MKKLCTSKSDRRNKRLIALIVGIAAVLALLATCCTGCKAWRTVSTTATCIQQNDSARTTTTISTKTIEEYQGVKKK